MNTTPTVLIIEDEPLIRSMLRAFLVDSGYRVVEAGDGRQGLDLFARERPDLVLTDLRMPVMNGLEVITALKARAPETPIFAMSGMEDEESTKMAVAVGAEECVSKPIDLAALQRLIESWLCTAALRAEPRHADRSNF